MTEKLALVLRKLSLKWLSCETFADYTSKSVLKSHHAKYFDAVHPVFLPDGVFLFMMGPQHSRSGSAGRDGPGEQRDGDVRGLQFSEISVTSEDKDGEDVDVLRRPVHFKNFKLMKFDFWVLALIFYHIERLYQQDLALKRMYCKQFHS